MQNTPLALPAGPGRVGTDAPSAPASNASRRLRPAARKMLAETATPTKPPRCARGRRRPPSLHKPPVAEAEIMPTGQRASVETLCGFRVKARPCGPDCKTRSCRGGRLVRPGEQREPSPSSSSQENAGGNRDSDQTHLAALGHGGGLRPYTSHLSPVSPRPIPCYTLVSSILGACPEFVPQCLKPTRLLRGPVSSASLIALSTIAKRCTAFLTKDFFATSAL